MPGLDRGRIVPLPKGDYNSATQYEKLDIVRYNKQSWICKEDCTGETPTLSSQYWQLLVTDGQSGSGTGDMLKSEYATNPTPGVVDKAAAVEWTGVQNVPYDTTPTTDSNNLMKSKDIKTALDSKGDMLKTEYARNGVTGVVDKAAEVDWIGVTNVPYDTTPTAGSNNLMKSKDIKLAIDSAIIGPGADVDTLTPTFIEASVRSNIASGETISVLFGKIMKVFSDLKNVAFTGSYNDLSNLPTIPDAQVNSDWNSTSGVSEILNKPTIPTELNSLNDVAIGVPSEGQVLAYNGTNWVNSSSGGGGASSWSQLTGKPFNTLDSNYFTVTQNVLKLNTYNTPINYQNYTMVDTNGRSMAGSGDYATFNVQSQKYYLLFTDEYQENGKYVGAHIYFIIKPHQTGTAPEKIEVAKSTNLGVTLTLSADDSWGVVSIKASGSANYVDATMYKFELS